MKKIHKYNEFITEEVSDDILCEIYEEDRIINTSEEEIIPRSVDNTGWVSFKPMGLWYSMGTEWIDWCRSEEGNSNWVKDNTFSIEVDEYMILILETPEEKREFEEEYGFKNKNGYVCHINWGRVAEKYYGIEIHKPWGPIGHWLNPWDISSGCIWNERAIKRIEKLGE